MVCSVYNAAKSAVCIIQAAYVTVRVNQLNELSGTVKGHLIAFFIGQNMCGCATANTVAFFTIGKTESCIIRNFAVGIGFTECKVMPFALCIGVYGFNTVFIDYFQGLFY